MKTEMNISQFQPANQSQFNHAFIGGNDNKVWYAVEEDTKYRSS